MSDVFVSYHRDDSAVAKRLADTLTQQGLSVFTDRAISVGQDFTDAIQEALSSAAVVVVLLSRNSQKRSWVKDEVAAALESRKKLIPVLLDSAAKENYIWPLISDRQATTVESDSDLRQLAEDIAGFVGNERISMDRTLPRTAASPGGGSRRLMIIVALAAALVGALITWLIVGR